MQVGGYMCTADRVYRDLWEGAYLNQMYLNDFPYDDKWATNQSCWAGECGVCNGIYRSLFSWLCQQCYPFEYLIVFFF